MKNKKKKINKVKLSILLFVIFILFSVIVFGEYLYNEVQERYFASKEFYFSSNILKLNNPTYNYSNWSGFGIAEIPIILHNYNNDLLRMNEDLTYEIKCESKSAKAVCSFSKNDTNVVTVTGPFSKDITQISQTLYVKAVSGQTLVKDNKVEIWVTAKGIGKYTKTLKAKIVYTITDGIDYEIEDSVGADYATVTVKNTSITDSRVTIAFDPTVVRLDINDEVYTGATVGTTTIQSVEYINSITFNMLPEASKSIKFYKTDLNEDYTYPGGASTSVVTCQIAR